jgi:predicted CxxxxCH...CXXCH cytochrome family protein
MVKRFVEVMNYSVPAAGSDVTTTIDMRFEAPIGAESFNDGTSPANDICVACHNNATRPNGSGTTMLNIDGNHVEDNDYTNNEQSKDCSGCHNHLYDATAANADGFMPLSCNGCHTFPGLFGSATDPTLHRLSASHDEHVGRPSDEVAVNNKGWGCSTCHLGSEHNAGTGGTITDPTQWAALVTPNLDNRVQVRFDLAWNPGTSPNPASTSQDNANYADGGNVCSNLYCHGAALGAQGTATTPAWGGAAACGDCHAFATNTLTSRSHQAHLTTATGAGALCADCHSAYDLAVAGTHVDGTVTLVGASAGYTGVPGDKLPATGLGGCGTNRCHNNGKTRARPNG